MFDGTAHIAVVHGVQWTVATGRLPVVGAGPRRRHPGRERPRNHAAGGAARAPRSDRGADAEVGDPRGDLEPHHLPDRAPRHRRRPRPVLVGLGDPGRRARVGRDRAAGGGGDGRRRHLGQRQLRHARGRQERTLSPRGRAGGDARLAAGDRALCVRSAHAARARLSRWRCARAFAPRHARGRSRGRLGPAQRDRPAPRALRRQRAGRARLARRPAVPALRCLAGSVAARTPGRVAGAARRRGLRRQRRRCRLAGASARQGRDQTARGAGAGTAAHGQGAGAARGDRRARGAGNLARHPLP